MKKNNILLAIQEKTPLSYKQVNDLYKITKSYDDILKINDISIEFNIDIIEVANFLYRRSGE